MKTISVIVPVYNVEAYLSRCVDSILNQTYKNLEIILVDDGSKDGSGDICDRYAEEYEQVRVVHKKNGGLSSARNAGLDVCTGEYISFIDSDDWIECNMYTVMIGRMENSSADIGVCRRYRVDENGKKSIETYMRYPEHSVFNDEQGLAYLMSFRGMDMSACDKIYSRAVIGDTRFPFGKTCEDSFTTYRIFASAKKIVYVDQPFYYYFFRHNSITRNSTVNKTVIEATEEQLAFIKCNYPSLMHEADSSVICAYLSVYNSYLQRGRECEELASYRRIVLKRLESGLLNKNISIKKKIQMIMFVGCPAVYKAFTLTKLERVQ